MNKDLLSEIKPYANLRGANLRGANLHSANLNYADLYGAGLRGADLRNVYLRGANLRNVDLRGANLTGADLYGAGLRGADLRGANLRNVDLRGANLTGADLRGANLTGADLTGADLYGAGLRDADLRGANLPRFQIPQEGELIVYKKLRGGVCKLRIPPEAKRTASLVGRKCRAEFAEVLDAPADNYSEYNKNFRYRIGDIVRPDKYDPDIRVECTNGIHFFLTREEAEEY